MEGRPIQITKLDLRRRGSTLFYLDIRGVGNRLSSWVKSVGDKKTVCDVNLHDLTCELYVDGWRIYKGCKARLKYPNGAEVQVVVKGIYHPEGAV